MGVVEQNIPFGLWRLKYGLQRMNCRAISDLNKSTVFLLPDGSHRSKCCYLIVRGRRSNGQYISYASIGSSQGRRRVSQPHPAGDRTS